MKFAADPDVVAETIAKRKAKAEAADILPAIAAARERNMREASADEYAWVPSPAQLAKALGLPADAEITDAALVTVDRASGAEPTKLMIAEELERSRRGVLEIAGVRADPLRPLRPSEALDEIRRRYAAAPGHVDRPDIRRRYGRFTLDRMMLERGDPDIARSLFAEMVVLDARANFATDRIEYTARSAFFDAVEQGEDIPEYEIVVDAPVRETFEVDAPTITVRRKR